MLGYDARILVGGTLGLMENGGNTRASRRARGAIIGSMLVFFSPELAGAALTDGPATYVAIDGQDVQYADRPGVAGPVDVTSVYLSRDGREIQPAGQATAGLGIGPCRPEAKPDRPHRSGADVSGHGYWERGGDCCPGGGRGKRSTARARCRSSAVTSWRNHVDVDVHGRWDTADKPFKEARVGCRV